MDALRAEPDFADAEGSVYAAFEDQAFEMQTTLLRVNNMLSMIGFVGWQGETTPLLALVRANVYEDRVQAQLLEACDLVESLAWIEEVRSIKMRSEAAASRRPPQSVPWVPTPSDVASIPKGTGVSPWGFNPAVARVYPAVRRVGGSTGDGGAPSSRGRGAVEGASKDVKMHIVWSSLGDSDALREWDGKSAVWQDPCLPAVNRQVELWRADVWVVSEAGEAFLDFFGKATQGAFGGWRVVTLPFNQAVCVGPSWEVVGWRDVQVGARAAVEVRVRHNTMRQGDSRRVWSVHNTRSGGAAERLHRLCDMLIAAREEHVDVVVGYCRWACSSSEWPLCLAAVAKGAEELMKSARWCACAWVEAYSRGGGGKGL